MRRRCITSLTGRDNERQQVFTGEDDHTRFLERDRTDRGKLKIYLHVLKDRNLDLILETDLTGTEIRSYLDELDFTAFDARFR